MITATEVDRTWQEQSRQVDAIQYRFETGRIDQDEYYAELQRVGEEAECFQQKYFNQFTRNREGECEYSALFFELRKYFPVVFTLTFCFRCATVISRGYSSLLGANLRA